MRKENHILNRFCLPINFDSVVYISQYTQFIRSYNFQLHKLNIVFFIIHTIFQRQYF